MVCSSCGLSGHNIRTCNAQNNPLSTKGVGVDTSVKKSQFSTKVSTSKRQETSINEKPNLIVPLSNKPNDNSAHSNSKTVKTYPSSSTLSLGAGKVLTKNNNVSKSSGDPYIDKVIPPNVPMSTFMKNNPHLLQEHQSSKPPPSHVTKLANLPKSRDLPRNHVKVFCDGCHNYGHLQASCTKPSDSSNPLTVELEKPLRLCSICQKPNHYKTKCPLTEGDREKAKLPGPIWLTQEAQERFRNGPTEKDGPGYIYMYTFINPKTKDDKGLFKIGMSAELPERRIKCQESRNGESYQVLISEETPYRKLTELLIHLHLNEFRTPRDAGDGRTEWFTGTREAFTVVIRKVIKEIMFSEYS